MSDDPREDEIEVLQAMYVQDGEFTLSPDDKFSFTLRLQVDGVPIDLGVSLPSGYPEELPVMRVMCDRISRDGIDQLTKGLLAVIEGYIGEPCVTAAADWLVEVASGYIVQESEGKPQAQVAQDTERKGLRKGAKCVFWEERGDLFEVGPEFAMCQTISKDLETGVGGLAVAFKKNFGGFLELKSQNLEVGNIGVLQKKGRCIYYLVIKKEMKGKPTMASLEACIRAMREHMVRQGVKKLAMPHIGCGKNHLSWGAVQNLLLQIFDKDDVELLAISHD
mmetsp:Transcript_46235/g.86609  ORF Transcript_46235/g.86609 Transcript_46235/m.86609 type:complete len:278 (-) Transcript_46235:89-922(-)